MTTSQWTPDADVEEELKRRDAEREAKAQSRRDAKAETLKAADRVMEKMQAYADKEGEKATVEKIVEDDPNLDGSHGLVSPGVVKLMEQAIENDPEGKGATFLFCELIEGVKGKDGSDGEAMEVVMTGDIRSLYKALTEITKTLKKAMVQEIANAINSGDMGKAVDLTLFAQHSDKQVADVFHTELEKQFPGFSKFRERTKGKS